MELFDPNGSGLALFDWTARLTHLTLVFIAVMVALVPLVAEKGGQMHRTAGAAYVAVTMIVFFFGMMIAIAEMSLLLFCFNIFLAYLLLSGWHAVMPRHAPHALDWIIPGLLAAASTAILVYALRGTADIHNMALVLFSLFGFGLAFNDVRALQRRRNEPNRWLARHIAGMVGSVIAHMSVIATTFLPGNMQWIWPATLTLIAACIAFMQWRKKQIIRTEIARALKPTILK